MTRYKPILIACPQYRQLVRGSYECDEQGRYRLDDQGQFILTLVRCGQRQGRCMETLCVLHRFNRGGNASWFPGRVLAMPENPKKAGGRRQKPSSREDTRDLY